MDGDWKGEGVVPSSTEQVINSLGSKSFPMGRNDQEFINFSQNSKLEDWVETNLAV